MGVSDPPLPLGVLVVFQVHLESVDPEDGRERNLEWIFEGDPHPGEEFPDPEKARSTKLRRRNPGLHFLASGPAHGEDDHRRLGPFPQSAEHFEAVHVRQPQV